MTAEAGIEVTRAPLNPRWIDELSPSDRKEYEIVRAENIEETTQRVEQLIAEHLGDSLDQGAVHALAEFIATKFRAAHDGGVQVGMDDKQHTIDWLEAEARRAARFAHNVVNM